MRHVAEGELHAWLDGALDQLGDERALEVREHLLSCAECQDRLAVEETVRARAIEVLALAAPVAVAAPPFEALVERARVGRSEGAGTPARVSHTARLGWAATVVIALGAGWMARELGLRPGVDSEGVSANGVAPSPSRAAEPTDVAPTDAPLGEPAQSGSLGREEAGELPRPLSLPSAPPPAAQGVLGAAVPADAIESAGSGSASAVTVTVAELDLAPLSGPARIEPLPVALRELPEVSPAVPPRLAADERPTSEDPRASVGGRTASAVPGREVLLQGRAASPVVPGARMPSFGSDRARESAGKQGSTSVTTEADPDEGLGLIVADLPVLRVEWTEMTPGRPGLRVLQQLASGDTLEIRFVRSGGVAADSVDDPLAPVVNAPLREGWSQVVRVHRDGWLVARARVTLAELELLVDRAGVVRR